MNEKEKENEKKREEFRKLLEEEEEIRLKIEKELHQEKFLRRKNFIGALELERREAALNGIVLRAQDVASLQQNQLQQEEKLAAELDILKRQEIVDMKMRQHLRENSHELKELESQLKAAYTKKAIAIQLAEKEATKYEDQIREMRAREILEKAVGTLEDQEKEQRLKEKIQKDKFRHMLQDQIIEKERQRQEQFIEFLQEKKMFDDILQTIKDEEVKELEEKKYMQQKLKEEMEQFYKAKEVWKARERMVLQQEEEKRQQILEEKAKIVTKDDTLKKLRAENLDKMYKKCFEEVEEKRRRNLEREELVTTLMLNAKEEEEKLKAQSELEKEIARRQEAKMAFKQLLAAKAQKEKEEKELDAQFARIMKDKIDEDAKKEEEKERQRRETLIKNQKYNEEAIKRNIQKRAQDLKLNQLINDLQEKEEKKRESLIEEERFRMLREHAPKLLGYFPKGCLREKDLEILGLTGNSPLPESCPLGK